METYIEFNQLLLKYNFDKEGASDGIKMCE